KKNKSVMVMSSLHPTVSISEKKKKKPETIEYYNHTKFGVDSLDQMCRLYSTKSGTRRWPVAVFNNILDIAGINAWILYKETQQDKITRRQFLQELAMELCRTDNLENTTSEITSTKKRKHCQSENCNNKSFNNCIECDSVVCGKCGEIAEKVTKYKCKKCMAKK
ncbi:Uncharacterized protein FKW44_009067, partial [Caligus rogercresseyi]